VFTLKITTSSFFVESGSSFSISYKVSLLIRSQLNAIISLLIVTDQKKDNSIHIIVSTSKNTKNVEIKGPVKSGKFIDWVLWLPYYEVIKDADHLKNYLHYYFDAVVLVFQKYDVPEEPIRDVHRIVENEVIGNPEYKFDDE
jgi:hypothetical protein